jgi:hypothetical protein
MTDPNPHPSQGQQVMTRQALADSHSFRSRVTPQGDLLDYIKSLEKRIAKLESHINTH